ncbi:MAG: hypothetical protein ACOWWO_05620 [Peptococcaceae bacterium]
MMKSIDDGDKNLPKGILDIIKEDYPEKYPFMITNCPNKNILFSAEEWLDILEKSRKSYQEYIIKQMNWEEEEKSS